MIEDSIFGVDSESLFEKIMIESLTNYFGGEIIKNENSSYLTFLFCTDYDKFCTKQHRHDRTYDI